MKKHVKPPIIEFSREQRSFLVDKIQRYMGDNLDYSPGNVEVSVFLDFMVEEVGRLCYNQGIKDSQNFMQEKIVEMFILMKEVDV